MNKYNYLNKKSGVYIIKNTVNDRVYIGSAINLYSRIKDHIKTLKSNTHRNGILQNHFNKYGMCFYFEVLELCDKDQLIIVEQFMIDKHKSSIRRYGFNINKNASSMLGFKHSNKTKKYWSTTRKGRTVSENTKNNMSLAKQGSKHAKAILNEEQVLEIRKNYDNTPHYSLLKSEEYGVSWFTIHYILKRKTWKHI